MKNKLRIDSKNGSTYIYDSKSNKIVKSKYSDFSESVLSNFIAKEGFNGEISFIGPEDNFLEKNKKTETLILNVTDACNLRCTYCAYSGHYPFEREHGNKIMSFDLAKKSIDFFAQREHLNPHISIYGGEPLVAKKLIPQIVEYAKSHVPKVTFSINTNATLFDSNWYSFFVDNDIQIQISIDGDKETHDKYRIDIKNNPTFDKIFENLNILFDKHEKFYRKNISFIATLSPPYDLIKLCDFYKKNKLLNSQPLFVNFVNPINTTFFDIFGEKEYFKKYESELFDVANDYIDHCVLENDFHHLGDWIFGSLLERIHLRSNKLLDENWINGSCTPGVDKIFVDTQGNFSPCERSGKSIPMGNVDSGISGAKVYEIVRAYRESTQSNCQECPNLRFCDNCYLSARDESNEFKYEYKYKYCDRRIEKLKTVLYVYVSVLEKNPYGLNRLWELLSNPINR